MTAASRLRFGLHCLLATSVGLAVRLVGLMVQLRVGRSMAEPRLCIESGPMGFDLLEVKEVEQSAREFFGTSNVVRNNVNNRNRYLRLAQMALRKGGLTHYWVDPRSGHQSFLRAVGQSIGLALLLARYRVVPIVWLTDVPKRRWRLQAEILSAGSGVCLVVVAPMRSEVQLCGAQFVGPMTLPLSEATLNRLELLKTGLEPSSSPRAVFAGSLYEPRASFLGRVQSRLEANGEILEIFGRAAGGERRPEEEYWRDLLGADVIVTTAMPVGVGAEGCDAAVQPHLVYRYTESLACRTALVAPHVPGADDVFQSGIHYLGFESEDECVDTITRLLKNSELRTKVAQAGHARLRELLAGGAFWKRALSAAARRTARN